jgi:hypothetical protein
MATLDQFIRPRLYGVAIATNRLIRATSRLADGSNTKDYRVNDTASHSG